MCNCVLRKKSMFKKHISGYRQTNIKKFTDFSKLIPLLRVKEL